jgi:hypothetical protein
MITGQVRYYQLCLTSTLLLKNYSSELIVKNRDAVVDEDGGRPSGSVSDEGAWDDMEGILMVPRAEEGIFMSNTGGRGEVSHGIVNYAVPTRWVLPLMKLSVNSLTVVIENASIIEHIVSDLRTKQMHGVAKWTFLLITIWPGITMELPRCQTLTLKIHGGK